MWLLNTHLPTRSQCWAVQLCHNRATHFSFYGVHFCKRELHGESLPENVLLYPIIFKWVWKMCFLDVNLYTKHTPIEVPDWSQSLNYFSNREPSLIKQKLIATSDNRMLTHLNVYNHAKALDNDCISTIVNRLQIWLEATYWDLRGQ